MGAAKTASHRKSSRPCAISCVITDSSADKEKEPQPLGNCLLRDVGPQVFERIWESCERKMPSLPIQDGDK